ncbi:TetR/AcrR family transcriptional regulator [Rhizobium skierniewicense]|uniref:TetR/AcrR family transcriptional regulator n=1 Tax=Rhizobium skierniewicense TaxID=984260 RepID=UPI001571C300|nr:TetR/AcrR family transcriptional regulator [Rhizobium skierniewicense]NTF34400.1 TetR/AcrR family transcriptional regulator [Rhizobium skierniewicense]
MKVTREQVAENRRRILDSASRLFRSKGVDAVSVAEVMQCAGLTHGGFYGHFSSKDDLVAQALLHILTSDVEGPFSLLGYLEQYLSADHRDNPGEGCPFAALASEMRHQSPQARAVMTAGARQIIDMMSTEVSPTAEAANGQTVIGHWAAMVGATILARAVDDKELSDRILEETRRFVTSRVTQVNNVDPEREFSQSLGSSRED